MLSFQQIQYILTLSEELQFQRASDRCFVTQPTLSMQIKKAEEELGGVIFDRSRQPLEMTKFGEELLPYLRDTLFEYQKINEFVARSKGVFKQEIRIAIIPTVAGYMLPTMYKKWKDQLKNVQLVIEEMKTDDLLVAMEDRKIDIGILSGPVFDPNLRSIPLYQEEIKAYFPTEVKDNVTTDELRDAHPWLLNHGNCLRTQMMDFCGLSDTGMKADWDYEGGNIKLLEKMVESYGGYTLVPNFYVQNQSSDYKTIQSAVGEIPAREVIGLVSKRKEKWETIEQIIRTIQFEYNSNSLNKNFKLLNWQ
jgi:LysR family transcriptional regulator, hydrogen peroxide-inducible genes activator